MKPMRLISVFLLVTFFAVAATTAKADAPEVEIIPFSGTWDFDCGKYIVRYEFQGTTTARWFWDQGFVTVHNSLQDAFYRMDGLGERYTHVEQNSLRWTGEGEIVHGVNWHMVIPGSGSVFIISGHFLSDWETGEIVYYHGNPNKNNVYPNSVCVAFAE